MAGTQLISSLPDESRTISIEPIGTELAPSVQVSLAKRIIHPRTNKVVCLAARTTVPIEEDEAASVSDLALRLSDGTNVVLSMSFFNDAVCQSGFTPFVGRRAYDPDRYESHRADRASKHLWAAAGVICAFTLVSSFYLIPQAFERKAVAILSSWKPLTVFKTVAAPPSRIVVEKVKPPRKAPADFERQSSLVTRGDTRRRTRKAGTRLGVSAPEQARSRSATKSGLIPPPPPTMAFPVSQMQMFNFAPYSVSPAVVSPMKSPPRVKANASVSKPLPQSARPVQTTAVTPRQFPLPAPAAGLTRGYSKPLPNPTSESSDSATTNSDTTTAPLPGVEPISQEQQQLERIVLP